MGIEQRLQGLEKQAAAMPRTGAQLLRLAEQIPAAERSQWLETLTDAELENYMRALDDQCRAAGEPVYNLRALTDEELERVCNSDTG